MAEAAAVKPVEGEAFTFPDETGGKVAFSIEEDTPTNVEVIDDTPPDDRGRKPLAKPVEDPTDEELQAYSTQVKERISELTHARHDERRAKEQTTREKVELERYAQQILNENKQLKEYVTNGQQAYGQVATAGAQAKLDIAKAKFKKAHEDFDTDALVAAQEEMLAAQMELAQAKSFRPAPLQPIETPVYNNQQQPESPRVDEKTAKWQARNPWFGDTDIPDHEEMTSVALIAHKQLVHSGVDPRSDEYFKKIDARVRARFPSYFEENGQSPEPSKRQGSVVAPATRSTATRKVVLTKTQVALAKRLGVPLEEYAKQVAKQQG
jgi:hypothetical protein